MAETMAGGVVKDIVLFRSAVIPEIQRREMMDSRTRNQEWNPHVKN